MKYHPLRFDRAAGTYGTHAEVQGVMGAALIDLLPPRGAGGGADPARILEMGCGTGAFSARLRERFPEAFLLATDASPRMLAEARRTLGNPSSGTAGFALFDAEAGAEDQSGPVSASTPYGLAASNALVQWFPDLSAHFTRVATLLAPGGAYLVSGFLRSNFPELNALLAEEPFEYRDFPGHSLEEVERAARGSFAVEALAAADLERTYPDPGAFLAVIKGLGSARRPESGRPLTRGRLELLRERYRTRYLAPGGVRATWRPWYALLRRP
ncbi:MAG TPA: methyltransferase [Fibrobacteria bacterium]|nr:methyltransferase [Fibrobacteria bacterium]